MTQNLKLLVAQINPTVGAIEANANKIIEIIQSEQTQHDAIVFPELALTGYPPEDLLFRKALFTRLEQALENIQAVTEDCLIIVGHPSLEQDHCYNSASLFRQGELFTRYHKQALPNYGVFDEKRYFAHGEPKPCVFQLKNYQVALCICEDLWDENPIERIIEQGANVLICMNASPFDYEKYPRREALVRQFAQRGLSVVYANLVGGQDELVFDGQSIAMDKAGNVCARADAFQEQRLSIEINENGVFGEVVPLLAREPLIYEALKCALKDYINKNGFPGVLIGLSGGIDSALTLAIAVDALGPSRVHAVLMPSRYTADISNEDALKQVKQLGVEYTILNIEPAFNTLLSTLAPSFKGLEADTTEENIQARIRGLLLMALSNKIGNMVLTTSNKSETAVGYATLYGDMVGGFAVIKDVLKTQVYALARYRNRLSAAIPERVIERAPSAELAEGQTDQDSLPEYETLDAILIDYMQNNLTIEEIVAKGFEPKLVARIIQMIKHTEYKRRQSAIGVKISPRAFGKDWRYPITSGF